MSKKDGINVEVGDKNEPKVRVPDIEIGESLKRLCKQDDIKETIYFAVDDYKKMTRNPWKDYICHSVITIISVILAAVVGHFFF